MVLGDCVQNLWPFWDGALHEEKNSSCQSPQGQSLKDLQLGNTNNDKKVLGKLAGKGRAHRKLVLGSVRSWKVIRA